MRIAASTLALVLVTAGFCLAAFGDAWAPTAFGMLAGSEAGAWLELVVPFFPLVFIVLGAALFASTTKGRRN